MVINTPSVYLCHVFCIPWVRFCFTLTSLDNHHTLPVQRRQLADVTFCFTHDNEFCQENSFSWHLLLKSSLYYTPWRHLFAFDIDLTKWNNRVSDWVSPKFSASFILRVFLADCAFVVSNMCPTGNNTTTFIRRNGFRGNIQFWLL